MGGENFWIGLVAGGIIGVVDALIMKLGVRRCAVYASDPRRGLRKFRRYTLLRIVSVTVLGLSVLRVKDCAAGLCLGFLLIHILFISHLVSVTRSRGGVKKGE